MRMWFGFIELILWSSGWFLWSQYCTAGFFEKWGISHWRRFGHF